MSVSYANRKGEFLGSECDVLRADSEGHVSRVVNWWLVYVGQFIPYCTEPTNCSAQVMRDAFEQLKQLFKVPIEV